MLASARWSAGWSSRRSLSAKRARCFGPAACRSGPPAYRCARFGASGRRATFSPPDEALHSFQDPGTDFPSKLQDVVERYHDPPADGLVPWVDEKSQIYARCSSQARALSTASCRARRKVRPQSIRRDTTILFAPLSVSDGAVIGLCRSSTLSLGKITK